ncbi:NosD domain-containing protein [Methanolapillus ohkumae]
MTETSPGNYTIVLDPNDNDDRIFSDANMSFMFDYGNTSFNINAQSSAPDLNLTLNLIGGFSPALQDALVISTMNMNVTNVTLNGNGHNIEDGRIYFQSGNFGDIVISNVNLSTSGSGNLIEFEGSMESETTTIQNSKLTNGSIHFNSSMSKNAVFSGLNITNGSLDLSTNPFSELSVHNNVISNPSSYVLILPLANPDNSSYIYNNKFISDSDYIGGSSSLPNVYFNKMPSSGTSIVGGPYIAGNYWSDSHGTGISDLMDATPTGYSESRYSANPSLEFIDYYPLTKYAAGGNSPIILRDTNESNESNNTNESNQTNQTNGTPSSPSPSGNSVSNTFRHLKNNNTSTEEVISDYIIPASVVIGSVMSAILMIFLSLLDTFFDVTSQKVRETAKHKKLTFEFNPPKWSEIFSARSALMVLMFFIGILVVDTLLGDTVDAAMNGGLLSFLTAIIPPIFVASLINIGGGLLLDELMDFVLEKLGKFTREKSGILDYIETNRHVNIAVFFVTIAVAVALISFFIFFMEWTLI